MDVVAFAAEVKTVRSDFPPEASGNTGAFAPGRARTGLAPSSDFTGTTGPDFCAAGLSFVAGDFTWDAGGTGLSTANRRAEPDVLEDGVGRAVREPSGIEAAAIDAFAPLTWEIGAFVATFAGFGTDFSGTFPSEAALGLETGIASAETDWAPVAADFRFDVTAAGRPGEIGSAEFGRTGVSAEDLAVVATEGALAPLPELPRAAGESDGAGWAATAFFTGGGAD